MQKQSFSYVFKIGILKSFAIVTGKHLRWSFFIIKLQAFRFFPMNIAKLLRAYLFIKHLRWLLLQMLYFTLYLQKNVAEYTVVLYCITVSFLNLKLLFCAIRCAISWYSSSFIVTRCHSLSLAAVHCHLLNTTCCHSLYYSLSTVVVRCHLLSFVVTRCTTRLSFYKRLIYIIFLQYCE